MNPGNLRELQYYTIARLTGLWILSGRLNHMLADKAQELTASLESAANDPFLQEKDLAEEAAKEGYRTLIQLRELSKTDPDRVERIMKQIQARFRPTILQMEIELYGQSYPNLTLSSMTIMAFAMFEQGLNLFCDALSEIRNSKLRLNDISGHSTIDKAKSYLVKVIEIDYDFSNSLIWSHIKGHQEVRNLLAHNLGLLDDSVRARKVQHFIQDGIRGLSIVQGSLVIQLEYIEELVNDFQKWLEEIYNTLPLEKSSA